MLNEAGYARYDERTSSMLGETAGAVLDRYGGDLRRLRDAAERDPRRERKLLKAFKGIGDVGADIFFREVQAAWEEVRPFADRRALDAARELGLGSAIEDLTGLVEPADFPRLVAALVRTRLAGDADRVRRAAGGQEDVATTGHARTKRVLYEEAGARGLPGRSSMTKQELAQALEAG